MRLDGFFRLSWLVQLTVGVTLFVISFLLEAQVLRAFFAAPLLGLALALALEAGKAGAVIWHRYLSHARNADGAVPSYPLGTRLVSGAFRFGLVGLSLLCSLLWLGAQLDRPNLAAMEAADEAARAARLGREEAALEARQRAALERLTRDHADQRETHQRQVEQLEALLRAEMDNVRGGTFKGERYLELERRLQAAEARRDAALAELATRQAEASARLEAEARTARATLHATAEAERRAAAARHADDERAQDPRIVALLRMLAEVFDWHLRAPLFVFLFALFLALLMELGIVLAFDTLTLAVLPVLATQHREEVSTEAMVAELNARQHREALRHHDAIDRIRKAGERGAERAEAHLDSQLRAA